MNGRKFRSARSRKAVSGRSPRSLEQLTRRLIQHAARSAPPSLAQRLEEEWLADLAERRGATSRLRLALGCCWATRVISYEHSAAHGALARPGNWPKIMAVYAPREPSGLSPRTAALLLIVCLHAALIYALATGLVQSIAKAPPPPMVASFPKDPRPPHIVPPPPRPILSAARIDPIEPVPGWPFPPETGQILVQPPDSASAPSPARLANRVVGGPGREFPNTDDYYPSASRRIGEKGAVTVRVCVDGSGRLTAAPIVAESSGSARLDEGALRLARAGSGHYRATTEDGQPVRSCYPFRIRFELRD